MRKSVKIAEIEKLLAHRNAGLRFPVTTEAFVGWAERYVKACKERAIVCVIEKVSASGMSRNLKFLQMSKSKEGRYDMLQFWGFFKALGYQEVKNSDCFRVHGCGMDMVFATNYNIIWKLHCLGFITRKECDDLAQRTPHKI